LNTATTATKKHEISFSSEKGQYMLGMGYRARCSCLWSSDCYAQMSDTQRAVEVHLRRANKSSFADLLARSSIGAALADVRARGIDVHLADLERETKRRTYKKKTPAKKLSAEDKAFMRGFGTALASIWRCHHDGQMIACLVKENNFTVDDFRDVGLDADDLDVIRRAVQR
jgi:hypothetical protein